MPKSILLKPTYKSEWLTARYMNRRQDVEEIDINGIIGGDFWEDGVDNAQLRQELRFLKNLDVQKIFLNVESPGGFVDHALAMHDLLAEHPAKIEKRIYGLTASSATIVAGAGDTITMSDNAMFFIHRMTSIGIGTPDDLINDAREAEKIEERQVNIYHK